MTRIPPFTSARIPPGVQQARFSSNTRAPAGEGGRNG
jgi:hypothetical protein